MPSPLTIDINKLVTNDTMVDLSTSSDSFISPKQFRSFAKSGERNSKRKERKKGCSMIATDTPERDRIEKMLCNKKLVKLTKELKAILQNINKKLLSGVARVSGAQGGYRTKVSLRRRSKSTCKLYIIMRKLLMRNYTNYAKNIVL